MKNKKITLKQVNDTDYRSIEEAAKELGIKTTAIRNYLHDGKLTTFKFKTLTLISKEDIELWKERQRSK